MSLLHPRIIISALRGGSGKTILSLGLASAWRAQSRRVTVFKKGPDFIDSGWLSFAAGGPCHNLDPFLMTREQMLRSFVTHSAASDVSIIEGNRGLFDGLDQDGCCSTAELGRILHSPVILIVDVTMATRTVAALVLGCQKFEPDLKIAGVVLNRVAGARQESIVRGAIEQHCGIPVLGVVPKLRESVFPERHMGLVPHIESDYAEKAVQWARSIVERDLDLPSLWRIAHDVEPPDEVPGVAEPGLVLNAAAEPVRIGVIRDRSFWFYYPENLRQLESFGATLVEIDSIQGKDLPRIDGLYIGGGFPETQAQALAENRSFKETLKRAIEQHLPVYAECGGLMYLGEKLLVGGNTYPMVGILPISFALEEKPQGHGYTVLEVVEKNPYFPVGEVLRGHEFHYSRPLLDESRKIQTVFTLRRGRGIDGRRDGIVMKNLLATYTHFHAAGNPQWGRGLIKAAVEARNARASFSGAPEKKD